VSNRITVSISQRKIRKIDDLVVYRANPAALTNLVKEGGNRRGSPYMDREKNFALLKKKRRITFCSLQK